MKKAICSFCGKEQRETFKMIASPNGDAFICDDCVKVCQDILKEKQIFEDFTLVTPQEIKKYLDKFIISQDKAKRILSVAVYNHYKRLKYNSSKDKKIELDKANILLCGPTGSGKTLLCKRLAEFLKVPFAEADATTITEAGYVGDDVESILYKLLQNANFDVKKAEMGIVYIDEIDKISKRTTNKALPRDPTGEGVQQGLLKILEGKIASVPLQNGRKLINQEMVTMDTSQILFICGGAFNGLDEIINKRITQKGMGFENLNPIQNTNQNITPEDLFEYGMIPEFIGRLPVIASLNQLELKDLEKILTEPENSLVKQYKTLFKLDGIDLEFEKETLLFLAQKAYDLKTGARGLKNVFENAMIDLMYCLPSKKIDKFIVNSEFIKQNKLQLDF